MARYLSTRTDEGGPQQSPTHQVGQRDIVDRLATPDGRWHEFGDDPIPVGYEHRFPACDETDIFAQSILEDLESNSPHADILSR